MKTVAEAIGVSRSNLAERRQERPQKRIGRPPLPDEELVAQIKAVIGELPTYGYRRVHAILKRQALAAGLKPPNHKRIYRAMKVHGLLLDRHAGGIERRHDGRIAVDERNRRWCSDGFEIGCDNGERVRVAFALDCCDREVGVRPQLVGCIFALGRDMSYICHTRRESAAGPRTSNSISMLAQLVDSVALSTNTGLARIVHRGRSNESGARQTRVVLDAVGLVRQLTDANG